METSRKPGESFSPSLNPPRTWPMDRIMMEAVQYEDLTAAMAEKLGAEGLIEELLKGFKLLAEPGLGFITPESLRRSSPLLGMGQISAQEAVDMVKEGDIDGDGALDEAEFCVLMVRLSPGIMANPGAYLQL